MHKPLGILFWCLILTHSALQGQQAPPSLQIGAGLTGYSYAGDFTVGEADYRRVYPGANLSLQFLGKRPLQLQVQVGFGKILEQQDKPNLFLPSEVKPNSFFQTSLFSTELRLRYRFFHRRRIQPFLGAGIGMLFFTPRDMEGNFLSENIFTRVDQEDYETTVPVIPLMGGVLLNINQRLSLGLDYTYRLVQSDYLDNIGQLGQQAGNDAIHSANLTLYFRLQPAEASPNSPLPPDTLAPELPLVVVADSGWLDMWEALYPAANALPPEVEITPAYPKTLYQELALANLPPGSTNWLEVESRAMQKEDILLVVIPTQSSLAELSRTLKVQSTTLQALNPTVRFPLSQNSQIRVPDMRGL